MCFAFLAVVGLKKCFSAKGKALSLSTFCSISSLSIIKERIILGIVSSWHAFILALSFCLWKWNVLMDMNDREGVLGEIRDGGERRRLIYNLTNTQRLAKPGVPALTRCHFNSSRRLHQNTDKRQNSSHCKGSRKLFTTAWREINVIRELQYNHTCFITAHSGSASIYEKTSSVALVRGFQLWGDLYDGILQKFDNLCYYFFYIKLFILILL